MARLISSTELTCPTFSMSVSPSEAGLCRCRRSRGNGAPEYASPGLFLHGIPQNCDQKVQTGYTSPRSTGMALLLRQKDHKPRHDRQRHECRIAASPATNCGPSCPRSCGGAGAHLGHREISVCLDGASTTAILRQETFTVNTHSPSPR
jgi:hypothetical protein